MSLNIACIYVQADKFLVKSIIKKYLDDFAVTLKSFDDETLLENLEKYYLYTDLKRELLMTPDIEGWVGIIDTTGFGIDPLIAKSISSQLSCKAFWIELLERSYSLTIGEFDSGRFRLATQIPEKSARKGLHDFFAENSVEFFNLHTVVPDYIPINTALFDYLQNSEIPETLWNLMRTRQESPYLGEIIIADKISITEEPVFFTQIENSWLNSLHLDHFESFSSESSIEPERHLNVETRRIMGKINTPEAIERLYLLEESWRKRIFEIYSQNDDMELIPEVKFKYIADLNLDELIEAEREKHNFGYWQLTDSHHRFTLKGFSEYVFSWIDMTYPHIDLTIDQQEKSISWLQQDENSNIKMYLDNLYLKYILNTPQKDIDEILDEHFTPIFKLPDDIVGDSETLKTDPGRKINEYFYIRLLNENMLSYHYDDYVFKYYLEGIRAYIGYDFGYGAFSFLIEEDLKNLKMSFEEIYESARENMRSRFLVFEDQFALINDEPSGSAYYQLGEFVDIDSSIVLLPEFPALARKIAGVNFTIGIPSRDSVYIFPEGNAEFMRRRKRELNFLFDVAPYPISPELINCDEIGCSKFEFNDFFSI